MSTRDKRIAVSFPPSHEIWNYPEGQRAARVRELVDLGLGSEGKFDEINKSLARIEEQVSSLRNNDRTAAKPARGVVVDTEEFMEI